MCSGYTLSDESPMPNAAFLKKKNASVNRVSFYSEKRKEL